MPPARGICGSTRIAARWGLERSADVGLDVVAHHRRLRRVDLEIRQHVFEAAASRFADHARLAPIGELDCSDERPDVEDRPSAWIR